MIPVFFMEVECIGNTQIIHMEETGMTQRTNGLLPHGMCYSNFRNCVHNSSIKKPLRTPNILLTCRICLQIFYQCTRQALDHLKPTKIFSTHYTFYCPGCVFFREEMSCTYSPELLEIILDIF